MLRKFFILLSILIISDQSAFAASKTQVLEGQLALACKPEEICIAAFRPIKTTLVVTYHQENKMAKVVKEIKTDKDGNFSLKLKAGIYSVSVSPLAKVTIPSTEEELKGKDLYITNGNVKVSKDLTTNVFLEALINK